MRCVIELERVPLADGAELRDLEFGEDYELLAAVADPGPFTVIGRCDEGEGVEIRRERRASSSHWLGAFRLEPRCALALDARE